MRQRKKQIGLKKPMYQGEKLMFNNPKKSLLIVHVPRGQLTPGEIGKMIDRIKILTGLKTMGVLSFDNQIRYTGIEVK